MVASLRTGCEHEFQMARRESPIKLNEEVRKALTDRCEDEHDVGHLYDRIIKVLRDGGHADLARRCCTSVGQARVAHARKIEHVLHAFDIDPPDLPHTMLQIPAP
ncbi:MAG: hypothetical protein CMJ81_16250 [Planctomycetaceae bacterium]|nr:hypothetical protein [Planctomycetaceae bacterium]